MTFKEEVKKGKLEPMLNGPGSGCVGDLGAVVGLGRLMGQTARMKSTHLSSGPEVSTRAEFGAKRVNQKP